MKRGESVNEFRRAARQKLFSCAVAVLLQFQYSDASSELQYMQVGHAGLGVEEGRGPACSALASHIPGCGENGNPRGESGRSSAPPLVSSSGSYDL